MTARFGNGSDGERPTTVDDDNAVVTFMKDLKPMPVIREKYADDIRERSVDVAKEKNIFYSTNYGFSGLDVEDGF